MLPFLRFILQKSQITLLIQIYSIKNMSYILNQFMKFSRINRAKYLNSFKVNNAINI